MTCEELIDDDVETLVYRPRSYIEDNPDFIFDPSASTKLERKNKSHERIPPGTPKRGSFSDLRNTILTRVGTPRGHRRSKTIVQKCESAGERLKSALARTSSLDVLGSRLQKPAEKHHKSMEEELMKGFSHLADKTVASHSKVATVKKVSDRVDGGMLNVRGKDRSHSCPSYPTIIEEEVRVVVKSSSYDNANYNSSTFTESQPTPPRQVFPTIKIELCASESTTGAKSAPLQRKHSNWSTKSSSDTSLCSSKTDSSNEYLSSDGSSVFNSENSIGGHTHNNIIFNNNHPKKFIESERTAFYKNKGRRPKSFVDIFKRENEDEFISSHTLPRRVKDCNSNTLEPKYFSEEEEEEEELDGDEKKLRSQTFVYESDDCALEQSRVRASSMVELRSDKKHTKKDSKLTTEEHSKHGHLKKTTSNIYALASPAAIKKLFKKKRRTFPGGNKSATKSAPTAHTSELSKNTTLTGSRKCIHIESLL